MDAAVNGRRIMLAAFYRPALAPASPTSAPRLVSPGLWVTIGSAFRARHETLYNQSFMHRLRALASALSLLLYLAALVLWIPSYRRAESAYVNWQATRGTAIGCEVESGSGCVALLISRVRGLHEDVPPDKPGRCQTNRDVSELFRANIQRRPGFLGGAN